MKGIISLNKEACVQDESLDELIHELMKREEFGCTMHLGCPVHIEPFG